MGHISHNFNSLNPLAFNPSACVEQVLLMQRKMLSGAVDLMFMPYLAKATQKTRKLSNKFGSKPEKSIASVLTAKLTDPALSFATAVETAEPLFDMLNEEI